jgi:alkylation response protein AidB-like acyl-CoA dehydrogenase
MPYIAQSRDAKFNLFEWLDTDKILNSELFSEFGKEDLEMIVEEALKVSKGSIAETNEAGDKIGAKFSDGRVTVPGSFKSAFEEVAGAGYIGSTASPEYSGMGLPEVAGTAVNEFIIGANTSLSLALLLTRGTAHLVETFGTGQLKELICDKMYTGTWAGTMCLTEPQAGSDLGDIQTKAIKQADGSYHLQGQKIFITWGEHDITGNIIHAVLARTPEAPVGSKGLSLFIVPKMRINPDGTVGESNNVTCAGIEHKMGIHGSPTCTLLFGEKGPSVGWILGKERMGLPYMFQMMNAARYEVGLQGLAIASAAHEAAVSYAKERRQGRPYNQRDPHYPQVPIMEHPDMRRTLATQKSILEAMRAIQFYTAWCMDMATISSGDEKNYYQGFVELFTPICKAWCTDRGFEITSYALQCYGGYGFTKEMPAEQYMRDARIAPIYEGTNAIQALDLVGRKFKLQGGDPVRRLLEQAMAKAVELQSDPLFGRAARNLKEAVELSSSVCEKMMSENKDPLFVSMNAVPVLDILGETLGGYFLLSQAEVARKKLDDILTSSNKEKSELLSDNENARFYHNKIQSALFFGARVLPFVKAKVDGMENEKSAMEFVF